MNPFYSLSPAEKNCLIFVFDLSLDECNTQGKLAKMIMQKFGR